MNNKGLNKKLIIISILSSMTFIFLIILTFGLVFFFGNNHVGNTDEIGYIYNSKLKKKTYLDNDGRLASTAYDEKMTNLSDGSSIFINSEDSKNAPAFTPIRQGDSIYLNYLDQEMHVVHQQKIFDLKRLDYLFVDNPLFLVNGLRVHHEIWSDGDYCAFFTSSMNFGTDGLTDDDMLIVLKNNGTENWDILATIDFMDILGYSEEDLVNPEDEYRIMATGLAADPITPGNQIDFLHMNAFDYNKESDRLFVSSRTLGAILVINLLSSGGPELEMILSNPITYNYSKANSSGDPITPDDGLGLSYEWNGYIANNDFVPELNDAWVGKTLNYRVNGTTYSSTDIRWDLSEEYMFMGQHYVRSLNSFLANNPEIYSGFDESKEYISIFDNHASQDNPYLMHWKEGEVGLNKYDDNMDGKWDKGSFTTYGDVHSNNEPTSYFKIIEIDPVTMTATLLANEELKYSAYISDAQLMQVDGENFVVVNSGNNYEKGVSYDQVFRFQYLDIDKDVDDSLIGWERTLYIENEVGVYRTNFIPSDSVVWEDARGLATKI